MPSTVRKCALRKLANEWMFMRAQATQPLAQFMDYTTFVFGERVIPSYKFMIDNVILILKMSLSRPSLSIKELDAVCNPLGRIPDHVMTSIASFENSPKGYQDLFQVVLIELPVGPYFCRYLDEQTENHLLQVGDGGEVDRRVRSSSRVCWRRARWR